MELLCACGASLAVADENARAILCQKCGASVAVPDAEAANRMLRYVDNPIFLRSAYARLRPPNAWIWLGIVMLTGFLIVGGAFALSYLLPDGSRELPKHMTGAFWILFGLQGLVLLLVGVNSIATGIVTDRETGVFEMMRLTPLTSWKLLAGYVLGMPLREHLWVLVAAPFAGLAVLFGTLPVERVVVLYIVLYAAAVVWHVFAAFCAIVLKNRRAATSMAVAIPMLLYMFGPCLVAFGTISLLHLTIYPTAAWASGETLPRPLTLSMSFYGVPCPFPLFDTIVMLMTASFLWLAALRKFRSDETPALAKPAGLVYGLLFAVVAFGSFYDGLIISGSGARIAYLLTGFLFISILSAMGTPSGDLHGRLVTHARRVGRTSLGLLGDGSPNLLFVALLLLPFVATLLLVPTTARLADVGLTASSLLLFALLLQWCKFAFKRNWPFIFGAALFLLWGIPIGLAILCTIASAGHTATFLAGGLFPGIALGYTDMEWAPAVIGLNFLIATLFGVLARRASRAAWA